MEETTQETRAAQAESVSMLAGITDPGPAKGYGTVAASREHDVPEPASAHLDWHGPDGSSIGYTATAGHVDVRTDDGELLGKMFAVSYEADREPGTAPRPVTFLYNGGPGSSSMPIHFGGMGPRRVRPDGTRHLSCPPVVEDNPHTLLVDSDLVFLDALGTGWSVLADGVDPKRVYGFKQDAEAFARAIACWLEEHDRWDSPVYLFGESYGTIRNAITMRLMGSYGIPLKGVVMMSAVFDCVQMLPGEDLYYLGMLPTYAATAHHFGKAGEGSTADEWFDAACEFVEGDYALALLKGDRLPERDRTRVARKLSKLIGLPVDYLLAHNLRVELDDFRRELLRGEDLTIGRLDTRYAEAAPSTLHSSSAFFAAEDAADDAVEAALASAFLTFCRRDLGYRNPRRYLTNNFAKVGGAWDWNHTQPGLEYDSGMANVAHDITVALRRNPTCKLAILGGRYDAATPWWNVEHDIACQFLAPELREHIEFHRYGCGHMVYEDEATLAQISHDLHAFYA